MSGDNPRMVKPKRGYSKAFTVRTERRLKFEADKAPATLHRRVLAKCKRTGQSVRTVILTLLSAWVDRTDDDEPPTEDI